MFDLLLRVEASARRRDGGLAAGAMMPVFKRDKKSRSRPVNIGVDHRLAFRADHPDDIAFLEVQVFADVRDMVKLDEFPFFRDPWA